MFIPDQGDIIFLDFEPSIGKEITKRRPALVLSRRAFNSHTNLAIVAPATSTIKSMGLESRLSVNMKTSGAVLIAQLKSFDYAERKVEFIEKALSAIIREALKKAAPIVS